MIADDPDAEVFGTCATGVRVGVGVRMPRTPAVYDQKQKWKLPGQRDAQFCREELNGSGVEQGNYKSAEAFPEEVERELRESVKLGFALEMTEVEARNKLGTGLVVASLGAQVKELQGDQVKLRLLFDGTHGVPVNERIRVCDRDRMPSAPDIKKVLRCVAQEKGVLVGIKLDVKNAHRLVPIAPCDWHLLCCRARKGGPLFVNRSGTFGVASAAYWWGRLAAAVVRLIHYLAGEGAAGRRRLGGTHDISEVPAGASLGFLGLRDLGRPSQLEQDGRRTGAEVGRLRASLERSFSGDHSFQIGTAEGL